MQRAPAPDPQPIGRYRTVGIFEDYALAKRTVARLLERGLPPHSIAITIDGSEIPVDKRRGASASARAVALVLGALAGGLLVALATATGVVGIPLEWPIAAIYGLAVGAVILALTGRTIEAVGARRRKAAAKLARNSAFRVVALSEEFERAADMVRPIRARRARRSTFRPQTAAPRRIASRT